MTPKTSTELMHDFTVVQQPGKTYRIEGNRIAGYTDGLPAVVQAARLILSTERFMHPLYSWNYGAELTDLFGLAPPLLHTRLRQRITEALLQDDRIREVADFSFSHGRGAVAVTCTVKTIYGTTTITEVLLSLIHI